eukprot:71183-Prorocentrum_lima.AAC.1
MERAPSWSPYGSAAWFPLQGARLGTQTHSPQCRWLPHPVPYRSWALAQSPPQTPSARRHLG